MKYIARVATAKLRDPEIRYAFSGYSVKRYPTIELMNEIRVNNGFAIADLVMVGTSTHCYEIKSDVDQLARALKQSISYDKSFPKVTLITTESQSRKAIDILPEYWGVVIAQPNLSSLQFHYLRKSSKSPFYDKNTALKILWKEELIRVLSKLNSTCIKKTDSRENLIAKIEEIASISFVQSEIANQLKIRSKFLSH